jgi:Fe2+ transport system protein FeoA
MPPPPDGAPAPLTAFARGQHVRIAWLGLDGPEAARLRDLGVREGCTACIMMNADKCILGLGACRLALQREVAMHLFATPAPAEGAPDAAQS